MIRGAYLRKSPAATMGDLAQAVRELLHADNPIQVIGTRHGEKLYESLMSREEAARAQNMGDFFRVPADTRDLNYEKYFSEGDPRQNQVKEYTSHNTVRLDIAQIQELLMTLECVREAIHRT